MGMVHLRNQISVHHSFDTSSALSISAAVGKSELTSRGLEDYKHTGSRPIQNCLDLGVDIFKPL